MEDIIYRQRDAARALTGKRFLLGVAGIVLRMAAAQIVINLLIRATGAGLLNVLFYVYCVWLLVQFMKRTVASYVYTLKPSVLVLERRLGDSTTSVVEIPLERIVSLRPVFGAERLKTTYRQVTVIDPAAKPTARVRAAFALSLVSARLARLAAGADAQQQAGHVLVFQEDGQERACVFRPNQELCEALSRRLDSRYGYDERMTRPQVVTLRARALQRAFPEQYAYVEPLVKPEAVEWAREELARGKQAGKPGKPNEPDKPRRRRKA
ncbi:MAG: hypothetical protein ACI4PG_02860 [Candidatus Ventricola sp.]